MRDPGREHLFCHRGAEHAVGLARMGFLQLDGEQPQGLAVRTVRCRRIDHELREHDEAAAGVTRDRARYGVHANQMRVRRLASSRAIA